MNYTLNISTARYEIIATNNSTPVRADFATEHYSCGVCGCQLDYVGYHDRIDCDDFHCSACGTMYLVPAQAIADARDDYHYWQIADLSAADWDYMIEQAEQALQTTAQVAAPEPTEAVSVFAKIWQWLAKH